MMHIQYDKQFAFVTMVHDLEHFVLFIKANGYVASIKDDKVLVLFKNQKQLEKFDKACQMWDSYNISLFIMIKMFFLTIVRKIWSK